MSVCAVCYQLHPVNAGCPTEREPMEQRNDEDEATVAAGMIGGTVYRVERVVWGRDEGPTTYPHCECGCGTTLHGRDHCQVIGGLRWRAVNMEHATRIVGQIMRYPFATAGTLIVAPDHDTHVEVGS